MSSASTHLGPDEQTVAALLLCAVGEGAGSEVDSMILRWSAENTIDVPADVSASDPLLTSGHTVLGSRIWIFVGMFVLKPQQHHVLNIHWCCDRPQVKIALLRIVFDLDSLHN